MAFFSSHLGMFSVQAVLHAFVAMFIVDGVLVVWPVRNPVTRFRYRITVLLLPVLQYPLFQLLFPERGSFYFRLDQALFDSRAWFVLDAWPGVSVGVALFATLAGGTALLTLLQEVIPITRDLMGRARARQLLSTLPQPHLQETVHGLAATLGVKSPTLSVVDFDAPLAFTAGAAAPQIIVSSGLLRLLDESQLRAVLAHEVAHVQRRSNVATLGVFLARLVLFFNPVSLLVFRRMVQDDEAICDDLTVRLTGDPHNLATALRAFEVQNDEQEQDGGSPMQAIESHSHALLLHDRIQRLESPELRKAKPFDLLNYLVVFAAIMVISFFVV